MHDAALHGFEPVFNPGDRTLENYVRCIIKKPVLVQAIQGHGMHRVLPCALTIRFTFGCNNRRLLNGFLLLFGHCLLLTSHLAQHSKYYATASSGCVSSSIFSSVSRSTLSSSMRRLSMINSCRTGVFLPI